jgi:hypothetical protein
MPRAGGLEYDIEDWDNDQQCLSDDALQLAHLAMYLLVQNAKGIRVYGCGQPAVSSTT